MNAILEALWVGVRVTFWIFKSIFVGYIEVFRWMGDRGRGDHYPFPAGRFLLALMLTVFLIWFLSLTNSGNRYSSTPKRSGVVQQSLSTYPNRQGTATANAVHQRLTLEAEGRLPRPIPLPTGRGPTSTRKPTATHIQSVASTTEPEASNSEQSASNTIPVAAPPPKTLTATSSDIRNSAPVPRLISVQTIPAQVISGQPFRVRVEATNEGGSTVDGYINISAPDNATLKIVSHSATGEGDANYIIEPGTELYSFRDGGRVEAVYGLAEVRIRSWPRGDTQHLEVEVIPTNGAQATTLYIRISLSGETLTDIYVEPDSSSTTDQQGFPVFSYQYP